MKHLHYWRIQRVPSPLRPPSLWATDRRCHSTLVLHLIVLL